MLFLICSEGAFLGVYTIKEKVNGFFFQDHIGSKKYYYSGNDGQPHFFSSGFDEIATVNKQFNISHELDTQSAYMLLSYGYMLEGKTLSTNH